MNYHEVMAALYRVQTAVDIVIIGRGKRAKMSASIPDGPVPEGWRATNEAGFQHLPGYRRIVLIKQESQT